MNDAIFWRLVWKEYRIQRGFWWSVAILTVAVQAVTLVYARLFQQPIPVHPLYVIALSAAALYALGCGATLFATERETGTYEFQRALPVSSGLMFVGKLAFALVSVLLLQLGLWLVTLAIARGQMPERPDHLQLWLAGLLGAWELLAWGILFSLLLRQPLTAAVLAMAAASLVVHLVGPLFAGPYHRVGLDSYLLLPVFRPALVLVLLAVDVCLGWRWLGETARRAPRAKRAQRSNPAPYLGSYAPIYPVAPRGWEATGQALRNAREQLPQGIAPLTRLVWHEVQQSWGLISLFSAIYLALVVVNVFGPPSVEVVFSLALPAWLMGSCVFVGDQRNAQFRFFAEHGLRPRWVWFSRQLVWFTAFALLAIVTVVLTLAVNAPLSGAEVAELVAYLGLAVICYAAGQLCSLYVRRALVAIVAAAGVSLGLCVWAGLMHGLRVNLLISVVPLPLVLLWASWLRAPDWMLERTTWRARMKAILSLAVPFLLVAAVVILWRVFEYPAVQLNFDLAKASRPATAEERETAEAYRRIWESIAVATDGVSPAPDGAEQPARAIEFVSASEWPGADSELARWVDEYEAMLPDAVAVTQRSACLLHPPGELPQELELRQAGRLATLLCFSGMKLESEGQAEQALERYLSLLRMACHLRSRSSSKLHHLTDSIERLALARLPRWATGPDQTGEQVLAARDAFEAIWRGRPPSEDAVKADYLVQWQFVTPDRGDRVAPLAADISDGELLREFLIDRLMPWERVRARRLLNLEVVRQMRRSTALQTRLRSHWAFAASLHVEEQRSDELDPTFIWSGAFWVRDMAQGRYRAEVDQEHWRRATSLLLALEAWRADHDRLPNSLHALVDAYLAEIPTDPYSAMEFLYYPQSHHVRPAGVSAGQPFLGSSGTAFPIP